MRINLVTAWAIAAIGVSAAAAHEFWIAPETFRPAVNAATSVRLFVGDGFPGEHKPRDDKKLERFDITGPAADAKAVPIEGKDGADSAGSVTLAKAGVYAIAYRGKESTITLEADKFEEYLSEEGLDAVLRQRRELHESSAAGREAYSRCAKSLICVGDEPAGAWDRRTGLTLEIVPVSNPYAAHAGDTIDFLLLRDGKPVVGAQVTALTLDAGTTVRASARTDAKGKVSFTIRQSGLCVIGAVLMDRVDAAAKRTDVDWVSVWSTLSFDLAPAIRDDTKTPSPAPVSR